MVGWVEHSFWLNWATKCTHFCQHLITDISNWLKIISVISDIDDDQLSFDVGRWNCLEKVKKYFRAFLLCSKNNFFFFFLVFYLIFSTRSFFCYWKAKFIKLIGSRKRKEEQEKKKEIWTGYMLLTYAVRTKLLTVQQQIKLITPYYQLLYINDVFLLNIQPTEHFSFFSFFFLFFRTLLC